MSCAVQKETCCEKDVIRVNETYIPFSIETDSATIQLDHLNTVYNKTGLYANFGFHFIVKGGDHFLVYLNSSKDSLIFINIFNDLDSKIISVNSFLRNRGKYTVKFIGDTIHLIDIGTYNYVRLKLTDDFQLIKIFETNLSKAIGSKYLFLNTNLVVDKKLVFFDPYLITFYGNYRTKNNIDSKAWMKINIQAGKSEKLFEYPQKYKDCDMRDFYSLIETVSDSAVLTVFRKNNELCLINVYSGEIIRKTDSFSFHSNYLCFDKSLEKNLAYTSKYDLLDEENTNLIWAGDMIFLIKRLRRENRKESMKCAILVFNNTLEHIATYFPDKSVWPRLSFGYRDGVIIMNDSLNRAYYYGFKKS